MPEEVSEERVRLLRAKARADVDGGIGISRGLPTQEEMHVYADAWNRAYRARMEKLYEEMAQMSYLAQEARSQQALGAFFLQDPEVHQHRLRAVRDVMAPLR